MITEPSKSQHTGWTRWMSTPKIGHLFALPPCKLSFHLLVPLWQQILCPQTEIVVVHFTTSPFVLSIASDHLLDGWAHVLAYQFTSISGEPKRICMMSLTCTYINEHVYLNQKTMSNDACHNLQLKLQHQYYSIIRWQIYLLNNNLILTEDTEMG